MALQRLLLNSSSIAIGASFASVAPVIGPGDNTTGATRFLLESGTRLKGVMAWGAVDLSAVRLVTGTLQKISPWSVRPFYPAAALASFAPIADLTDYQVNLGLNENLDIQASNAGAGAITPFVLTFLSDGMPVPKQYGDYRIVRATANTATVANTWTTTALTFDNVFPDGEYKIVNIEVIHATGICFRVSSVNDYQKPGMWCLQSRANAYDPSLYQNPLFDFGRFSQNQLPSLEIYATGVANAEVFMHVCKVR